MSLLSYRAQLRALAFQKGVELYDYLLQQGVTRAVAHSWVTGSRNSDIKLKHAVLIAAKLSELPDVKLHAARAHRKVRSDRGQRRAADPGAESSAHAARPQLVEAG